MIEAPRNVREPVMIVPKKLTAACTRLQLTSPPTTAPFCPLGTEPAAGRGASETLRLESGASIDASRCKHASASDQTAIEASWWLACATKGRQRDAPGSAGAGLSDMWRRPRAEELGGLFNASELISLGLAQQSGSTQYYRGRPTEPTGTGASVRSRHTTRALAPDGVPRATRGSE
ncbi:hypothetical protein VTO73DRAFT_2679 [Trametes versicolor]